MVFLGNGRNHKNGTRLVVSGVGQNSKGLRKIRRGDAAGAAADLKDKLKEMADKHSNMTVGDFLDYYILNCASNVAAIEDLGLDELREKSIGYPFSFSYYVERAVKKYF